MLFFSISDSKTRWFKFPFNQISIHPHVCNICHLMLHKCFVIDDYGFSLVSTNVLKNRNVALISSGQSAAASAHMFSGGLLLKWLPLWHHNFQIIMTDVVLFRKFESFYSWCCQSNDTNGGVLCINSISLFSLKRVKSCHGSWRWAADPL